MNRNRTPRRRNGTGKLIFGIIFTVIGAALLIQRITGRDVWSHVWQLWPALLVIVGVKVLVDHYVRSTPPRATDVLLVLLVIIVGLSTTAAQGGAFFDLETQLSQLMAASDMYSEASPTPGFFQFLPTIWHAKPDPALRGLSERWYAPDFDDSAWPTVTTAHMWCLQEGPLKNFAKSYAWGRVKFSVDPKWRDKRIMLRIRALDGEATVYLNGEPVGSPGIALRWAEHPVNLEITGRLRFDQPNTLAVLVHANGTVGGVYRPVMIYVPRMFVTYPKPPK